jgi:hypothetical protein
MIEKQLASKDKKKKIGVEKTQFWFKKYLTVSH